MGALSSHRKRRDDFFKTHSFSIPFDQSYDHISKKPKLSVPANQTTPLTNRTSSSNSIASMITQYPDSKRWFSREVHAPVRNSRTSASNMETPADKIGAYSLYQKCRDVALRTIRYVFPEKQNKKEVIELDSEDERGISNDSNGAFQRWKEGKGNVENLQEPNADMEKEVKSLDSSVVTELGDKIAKDVNMEKTGLLLLLQSPDDDRKPSYIRLYDRSKRRDGKLANIKFDIELQERRFEELRLSRPPKIEESIKKDVTEECFVPLTDGEKQEISCAFSSSNRRKVLVAHTNSCIDITGEILQCLKPRAWLNDEVINLYFELLKEREKREPKKFLKCHFFNTFFYKKLISGRGGYNFQSLRRWTSHKKLGYSLSECDKIFVPVHKEIHWCLAIINKKDEKFQYLDSLGDSDDQVLNVLAKYFVDEVKDKCGKDINISSWEREIVTELPKQLNGFDCGVFMIKYADFYSRDVGLCFSQDDMPYFRLRTAKEILKLRAN